jgi:hypothetical protein
MSRKYLNHIQVSLPSSFTLFLPLFPTPKHNLFYIPFLHCFNIFHCSVEFYLGILPLNVLYFSQSNPIFLILTLFLLSCIVEQFSVCFLVSYSYTDVTYFSIIHSLSFFSSSLSLLLGFHF